MKIVVTGASGFIGAKLTKALLKNGDHVIAVDRNMPCLLDVDGLSQVRIDIAAGDAMAEIFEHEPEAIVHLASLPGGASELDPGLSRRVNLDGALNLIDFCSQAATPPRFIFASSIAALGDALPKDGVDDTTPLRPTMIYGLHKAMVETAVAAMTRRGAIDGLSLRLPGIIARPSGPSGLKSAFMSEIFHRLRAGERFISPVSPRAQFWLMSVDQCVCNLVHALRCDSQSLPKSRAITLPALHVQMETLVQELARATGVDPGCVAYHPDPEVEKVFGSYPPLVACIAEEIGFSNDGDLTKLVATVSGSLR
ncbi:MAG: NAD-dependent epimerase/dehydratase family protein [Parvularculaceae bacterium]|nr:NAD-dependent epimerase/dehydratase family protein [Parvularculaceae bacterium]